ncbi:MAG: hypothetical protein IJ877_05365 [Candidatus Gastranaerophilales bacterium]|nr:hypothetical protein [Candidatus Gastranaerophilales bacterium]
MKFITGFVQKMKIQPVRLQNIYNLKKSPYFKGDISAKTPQDSFEKTTSPIKGRNQELENYYGVQNLDETSKNIFVKLGILAYTNQISDRILRGWSESEFDENFTKDAQMYFQAIKDGLSKEEINNLFIKTYPTEDEGMQKTEAGKIFEVNDSLYLKMSNKFKFKLKISKDTYMNLFPPLNFYSQGKFGDCYLLSAITSMWDSPFYKAYVLNCFEETDDNKIRVHFPNGKACLMTDSEGNLPDEKAQYPSCYIQGSNGYKLLEALFEDEITLQNNDMIVNIILQRTTEAIINNKETDKTEEKIALSLLNSKDKMNPEYVISNIDYGVEKLMEITPKEMRKAKPYYVYKFSDIQEKYKDNEFICTINPSLFYRSEEGNVMDAYRAFGLSGIKGSAIGEITDKLILTPDLLDIITQAQEGYVYTVAIKKQDGIPTEMPINSKKGLYGTHAYALQVKKDENNEPIYVLCNPFNSARRIKLTREEMLKYVKSIGIAQQKR